METERHARTRLIHRRTYRLMKPNQRRRCIYGFHSAKKKTLSLSLSSSRLEKRRTHNRTKSFEILTPSIYYISYVRCRRRVPSNSTLV